MDDKISKMEAQLLRWTNEKHRITALSISETNIVLKSEQ